MVWVINQVGNLNNSKCTEHVKGMYSLEYDAEILKKVEILVALFSEYQLVTLKLVPAVNLV